MKNGLLKTGTFLMICFLFACSGNSPKSVAENFLKAMNKMDFDGAKKYGTEDTNKMLDMLSGFAKMMPDSAKKEDVKMEITSEKIEGDKATYTYKEEGKDGDQTINLVKVDGKWKVAMSKDDMNSGHEGEQMDSGATSTDTSSGPMPDSSSSNR
jgi:hypothetical protein